MQNNRGRGRGDIVVGLGDGRRKKEMVGSGRRYRRAERMNSGQ